MDCNFKKFFLSLGLIGFSKRAPGTLGSFVGFIFLVLLKIYLPNFFINIFIWAAIFLIVYFLSINYIQSCIKEKNIDQQWIVTDEFLGMSIAGLPFLFFNGFFGWYLIGGFILFRFFDVYKPGIVYYADKINTAQGVMLDDIIAGGVSAMILIIVIIILNFI
jgi:phosphatidylglycerophosphatase A